MPVLKDYDEFEALHWETGTVRNFLAYRGVRNPYTDQPYSEAFLMGVSGGAVMGYFSFAYEGYDPQARILTRNTFDPLETMLSRLGVVQNRLRTASPSKGEQNLVETLESRVPAIVWADMYSLPYNLMPEDEGMWAMFPILVYGYDRDEDCAWIADRARAPLTTTTGELAEARARVKKDKFQILTLDPPLPEKIPAAVRAGIWDCIKLYTEKPPKGTKKNFGLAALNWWADLLVNPKARLSWAKEFPAGVKLYAGLRSAFEDINTFGKDGQAERDTYADFLEEAGGILENPGLDEAAGKFRASAQAWDALSEALFPDEIPLYQETRELIARRHRRFLEGGDEALDEMQTIDDRLAEIRGEITPEHPLDQEEAEEFKANLRDRVMAVHDKEEAAVTALRAAMS